MPFVLPPVLGKKIDYEDDDEDDSVAIKR